MADEPSSLVLFALSFGVLLTFVLFLWAINAIKDRVIMSRLPAEQPPDRAVADQLPATQAIDGQPIAKPGNAVNAPLPGNTLPDEVRAIIRFQAKVEATVAIVKSGKVGQTEAIELIFECKRSGRAESDYAKARAAVLPLLETGPQFRPLTPEQQAARAALGLDRV